MTEYNITNDSIDGPINDQGLPNADEYSNTNSRTRLIGLKYTYPSELDSISKSIQGVVSCFHCTLVIDTPIYAIQSD